MDLEIPCFTKIRADFYGFPLKTTCQVVKKKGSLEAEESTLYSVLCACVLLYIQTLVS